MNRSSILMCVFVCLMFSGCAAKHWNYQPIGGQGLDNTELHAIVLAPFQDQRPSRGEEGASLLWLAPFVPFSDAITHYPDERGGPGTRSDNRTMPPPSDEERRLEASLSRVKDAEKRRQIEERLKELRRTRESLPRMRSSDELEWLLAAALADDLKSSGLFEEVYLLDSTRYAPTAEIIIHGRLELTEQRRSTISYGLTVAGPVLWLFFPATSTGYRLAYTIEVENSEGVQIMRQTYRLAEERKYYFIYQQGWGALYTKRLPTMINRINERAVRDIARLLELYPDDYWNDLVRTRLSVEGN